MGKWFEGTADNAQGVVVHVVSEPPGASVHLDRERRFGVTPISLYGVTSGRAHDLLVVLEDHAPWRERLTLGADERERRVIATLTRTLPGGEPGSVEVQANVEAEVYLDGEYKGKTPILLSDVRSGMRHEIVVKRDGFEREVIEIDSLEKGARKRVEVELKATQGKAPRERPRVAPHPVSVPRAKRTPLGSGQPGEQLPGR